MAESGQPAAPAPSASTSSSWFKFSNPFLTTVSKAKATADMEEVAQLTINEDEEIAEPVNSKAALAAQKAALAKEKELQKREAELRAREEQLREAERKAVPRVPNFPFFWPVMFHNIKVDIPKQNQTTMLWMYRSWVLLLIILLVNVASCLAILVSHPTGVTTAGQDFGESIMYFFGVMIASFYLWYRPVYNAFTKESSLLFSFYFFFGGFHILYDFYMALGIPGSGSAGIIYALSVVTDKKYVAAIFCAVNSSLWLIAGLSSTWLYYRVHRWYRSRGLTSEDAKNEAINMGAKSGIVQGIFMKSAQTNFA